MTSTVLLWQGPSQYDGQHCFLTGSAEPTRNRAVGNVAVLNVCGLRSSICGQCPGRPKELGGKGWCFVNWTSQEGVMRALERGTFHDAQNLDPVATGKVLDLQSKQALRLMGWGDSGAVPPAVIDAVRLIARTYHVPILGYTHAWRERPDLGADHMASVEDEAGQREAEAFGWGTFRVLTWDAEPKDAKAYGCAPCMKWASHGRITCGECLRCSGPGWHVGNADHGNKARAMKAKRRAA